MTPKPEPPAAYEREEVNHDAALVLAALDLGLQAWRTTPSRTRFTDAVAALGWLREAATELVDLREAISRVAQFQPDPLGFWDDLDAQLVAVRRSDG